MRRPFCYAYGMKIAGTDTSDVELPRGKLAMIGVLLVLLMLTGVLAYWLVRSESVSTPATSNHGSQQAADKLRLTLFATGLSNPTTIVSSGSASDNRLFVTDRDGIIRIVEPSGSVNTKPFLDISSKVMSGGEMGLLGLAFSPGYAKNGYFFINYINKDQSTVIARYHVSADGNIADPSSEQVVLRLKQPYTNHNGGALAFGRDGYLYAALGDGGGAGDPENRAQDPNGLFGKILRLDVHELPYKIPPSNPFANQPDKRGEIWDMGLRNPWRFSFDRTTGDLYVADVGQDSFEEIDVESSNSTGGNNYGWRCYEGDHEFNPAACKSKDQYVLPVATYDHSENRCSVTGGYVYRGNRFPGIRGHYFYADYCNGTVYSLMRQNGKWVSTTAANTPYNISAFGEDSLGELYMSDFATGSLYALEASR